MRCNHGSDYLGATRKSHACKAVAPRRRFSSIRILFAQDHRANSPAFASRTRIGAGGDSPCPIFPGTLTRWLALLFRTGAVLDLRAGLSFVRALSVLSHLARTYPGAV